MFVVEGDVVVDEVYGADVRVGVEYFLLFGACVLEDDAVAGGVDQFAFADDGAEGDCSVHADHPQRSHSLER